MNKILASEFGAESWRVHGLSWTRSVKSLGYGGLVVDSGLPPDAIDKLSELRFRVIGQTGGPYASVLEGMKEDEKCLFCPCDFDFKDGWEERFGGAGLSCGLENDLPLANIVLPISSIHKRAETATLIEQRIISAYGKPLDPEVICGDWLSWAGFVGYYQFLIHSGFLEPRIGVEKVAINLYALEFRGRVNAV